MCLTFSDLAGARTQDPNIKSVMLYQLSYQVFFSYEGANIKRLIIKTNPFLYKILFFCCIEYSDLKISKIATMNIFLVGYMASGKSTVGRLLASRLRYNFIDLDSYIEEKEGVKIPEIFSKKGEIYFRKKEAFYLKEITIENDKTVIALGGGTPCYGNNMEFLKTNDETRTIYLRLSIQELTERLSKEKENRPVVSHLKSLDELQEFIGKHLFERQFFYNQADIVLDANGYSPQKIVEKIVMALF